MKFMFNAVSAIRLFVLFTFVMMVSCTVGDGTPPATTEDLSADPVNRLLNWTAPGDNGDQGTATIYFVRYYDNEEVAEILGVPNLDNVPFPVIEETVRENFNGATQIVDFQVPEPAGNPQSFLSPRLDLTGNNTYFYSMRTNDEVGNSSQPSNVAEIKTPLTAVKYVSNEGGSCIGEAIGSGNFNGDQADDDQEIEDLAIGDPCNGKVYLFYGKNDLTNDGATTIDVSNADVTIIGRTEDMFGASLAGIPDFEGDIRADELVIGAPGFDNSRGKTYVVFGSRELPSVIDLVNGDTEHIEIVGESAGDEFGFSVSDGDDVINGSSVFIVGAPLRNASTGKVYIFRGPDLNLNSVNQASDARAAVEGQAAGGLFGFDLALLGRIDGNNFDEFGVGAPGLGRAYVIFGRSDPGNKDLSMDTTDTVILTQGVPADMFGFSISGDGDINEDGEGEPDVIVGAPDINMETGSVYLYSGEDIESAFENGTELSAATVFTGSNPGDRFGNSVTVIPDLTPEQEQRERTTAIVLILNTSNADLAIGAPGTTNGTVYVFFGSDDMPATIPANNAAFSLQGNEGDTGFGEEVCATGDVNGDFFEDFAAGGNDFMAIIY